MVRKWVTKFDVAVRPSLWMSWPYVCLAGRLTIILYECVCYVERFDWHAWQLCLGRLYRHLSSSPDCSVYVSTLEVIQVDPRTVFCLSCLAVVQQRMGHAGTMGCGINPMNTGWPGRSPWTGRHTADPASLQQKQQQQNELSPLIWVRYHSL